MYAFSSTLLGGAICVEMLEGETPAQAIQRSLGEAPKIIGVGETRDLAAADCRRQHKALAEQKEADQAVGSSFHTDWCTT